MCSCSKKKKVPFVFSFLYLFILLWIFSKRFCGSCVFNEWSQNSAMWWLNELICDHFECNNLLFPWLFNAARFMVWPFTSFIWSSFDGSPERLPLGVSALSLCASKHNDFECFILLKNSFETMSFSKATVRDCGCARVFVCNMDYLCCARR